MKLIMESWKRYLNESKEIWKADLQGKVRTKSGSKSSYRIVHIPSSVEGKSVSIPSTYHRALHTKKEANAFIDFLNSKSKEWAGIDSESLSDEVLKKVRSAIIKSEDWKNSNFNFEEGTTEEK